MDDTSRIRAGSRRQEAHNLKVAPRHAWVSNSAPELGVERVRCAGYDWVDERRAEWKACCQSGTVSVVQSEAFIETPGLSDSQAKGHQLSDLLEETTGRASLR